jgi:hypothetical protein
LVGSRRLQQEDFTVIDLETTLYDLVYGIIRWQHIFKSPEYLESLRDDAE